MRDTVRVSGGCSSRASVKPPAGSVVARWTSSAAPGERHGDGDGDGGLADAAFAHDHHHTRTGFVELVDQLVDPGAGRRLGFIGRGEVGAAVDEGAQRVDAGEVAGDERDLRRRQGGERRGHMRPGRCAGGWRRLRRRGRRGNGASSSPLTTRRWLVTPSAASSPAAACRLAQRRAVGSADEHDASSAPGRPTPSPCLRRGRACLRATRGARGSSPRPVMVSR